MIMFAVIDTETTGLIDDKSKDFMYQPGIVQVGIVILDDKLEEVSSLSSLVNPDRSASTWAKEAIETHGITPEQVQDLPSYMELHPQVADLMRGCKYWVGYNTKFDRDVFWYQLLRYGLEKNFPWPPDTIDVMRHATSYVDQKGKKGSKFLTLSDAYTAIVGGTLEGAHDALSDVRGTAAVLRKLVLDGGLVF